MGEFGSTLQSPIVEEMDLIWKEMSNFLSSFQARSQEWVTALGNMDGKGVERRKVFQEVYNHVSTADAMEIMAMTNHLSELEFISSIHF